MHTTNKLLAFKSMTIGQGRHTLSRWKFVLLLIGSLSFLPFSHGQEVTNGVANGYIETVLVAGTQAGTFTLDYGDEVPLWDLSGSYSGTIEYGIGFNFNITQSPSGKIIGNGTLHSNSVSGIAMNGKLTVTGAVKSAGKATVVSMTLLSSGSGTAFSTDRITFTGTMKLNADVDGSNGVLAITDGSVAIKIKDAARHKLITETMKIKSSNGYLLPLPKDVTGDWDMVMALALNGIKYTGTTTVSTSTSAKEAFKVTGSYTAKTNTTTLALKGVSGNCLNMNVSISGTDMAVDSIKGKLFGQSITYKP